MWLFTTVGFFSVTRSKDEPEMMQVRARERHDLESLIAVAGIDATILETPEADYRWRIIVRPKTATQVIALLVDRIDYSNFKNAVHDSPGQENKAIPYMRVWSVMNGLQNGTAGGYPHPRGDLFDVEEISRTFGVSEHDGDGEGER
jgi:hypothetical protein